jgi:hypothetical protein
MTTPEGEAFVEFHADTSKVEPEARRGIDRAAENIERTDTPKIGDEWGESVGKAMGNRLEREGPGIARKLEQGTANTKVRFKTTFVYDRDNNVIKRIEEQFTTQLAQAFQDAGRPGGPIGKIGQGIADAIGAGFNVSGKSPLIALLIPLLGTIVALVLAAVQALNAFVTLLGALPVLILGIAAQIGVLFIAFQGVGTAIQGAFAAKNAKELKEALKDLVPQAQAFVKELLPLKPFFEQLKKDVQTNFFGNIRGDMTAVIQALSGPVAIGFRQIADDLGRIAHSILGFLSSKFFQGFLTNVFGDTSKWLKDFGPALERFFIGLTFLANATRPLLDSFGGDLNDFIANLGRVFAAIAQDPDFPKFLEDMKQTFNDVFHLLNAIVGFVVTFAAELNRAGGNQILQTFTAALEELSFFFASPVGQRAMEGLVHGAMLAIGVFTGLIIIISSLFALFEAIGEYFKNGFIPQLQFLGNAIVSFFQFVGGYILGFFRTVGQAILDFVHMIGQWFTDMYNKVKAFIQAGIDRVKDFYNNVKTTFANAGSLLVQAGQNILQGLINGILAKWNALKATMASIAASIRNFWPFSPAKVGPLSGSGDPLIAGQKIVTRLAAGMNMEIPAIQAANEHVANNITFGPGAIQQNFNGLPDSAQAKGIGGQVANGIFNGIAIRDARIAVRVL